jgi:hypothetical protein
MKRGLLLLAAALAAGPLSAQPAPPFRVEATATASYEGAATEEPLAVVAGTPSTAFSYHGDAIARSLGVSATAYQRPVEDDGATPLALLPFTSRASSLRLDLSLTGRSVDSSGENRGAGVTLRSDLTGDRDSRGAGAFAEWFFDSATSARAAVSGSWLRATDVTRSLESPSGRGAFDAQLSRVSSGRAGLGASRRFGGGSEDAPAWRKDFEGSVTFDGAYVWGASVRTDQVLFITGPFETNDYELDSRGFSLALSSRTLFFSRRASLDVEARYDRTTGDLEQKGYGPLDASIGNARRGSATATWYPLRALGVFLGAVYATESDSSGLDVKRPVSYQKAVSVSVGARLFFAGRTSAAVTLSRTTTDTVNPPVGDTFQMLVETRNRVELSGAIRF